MLLAPHTYYFFHNPHAIFRTRPRAGLLPEADAKLSKMSKPQIILNAGCAAPDLHAAAKGGDVDAMARLLDDGAEVDRANKRGHTPLLWGPGGVGPRSLEERGARASVHAREWPAPSPRNSRCNV